MKMCLYNLQLEIHQTYRLLTGRERDEQQGKETKSDHDNIHWIL